MSCALCRRMDKRFVAVLAGRVANDDFQENRDRLCNADDVGPRCVVDEILSTTTSIDATRIPGLSACAVLLVT